jgi:hypothetical protein
VSRDGKKYTRLSREAFVPRGIGHPRVGFPGVFEGAHDSGSTTIATGSYDVGDVTVMVESGWQVHPFYGHHPLELSLPSIRTINHCCSDPPSVALTVVLTGRNGRLLQVTHAGIDAMLDPALAPNLHPSGDSKLPGGAVLSGMQLLTSRRNGMVSLQTTQPSVEGVWLSKSLHLPTCDGSPATPELGLSLNCMASIDGYLLPSLLTSGGGKHMYTPSALLGVPIIGNVMDELVRWRNQTKLLDEINPVALPRAMQGTTVQLRVAMKAAHLFSFRFECVETS